MSVLGEMDWVSVGGAGASLLGAGVAVWQARRAIGARQAIENYSKLKSDEQDYHSYTKILQLCEEIEDNLLPFQSKTGMAGIEPAMIAAIAIKLRRFIKQVHVMISDSNILIVEGAFDRERIEERINKFETSRRDDERVGWAIEVVKDIRFISKTVRQHNRAKQESVDVAIQKAAVTGD